MTHATDEELVAQARAGSRDAGAELFRRHWPGAWRAALAVVGSPAAAEDVAQDAFQRAFGALERFDLRRPFAPWLQRIVVNRAIDVARRERRVVATGQTVADVPAAEEPAHDPELLAALARLDPARRAVIALRYWLDFSPPEIAEALELPVGTVTSRLSRGLAELRQELEVDRV